MRRADRLFQIIQILRRSTRPVTAAALAEELEISKRTVYRDNGSRFRNEIALRIREFTAMNDEKPATSNGARRSRPGDERNATLAPRFFGSQYDEAARHDLRPRSSRVREELQDV